LLNFETNFFTATENTTQHTISGDDLHMLVRGYHFDDDMTWHYFPDKDRIYIMAGDGSLITLVNQSYSLSGQPDTGIYVYEGKELHYIAHVTYTEPDAIGLT